jgi:cytochrome c oxidase cbb3-type subunit 3
MKNVGTLLALFSPVMVFAQAAPDTPTQTEQLSGSIFWILVGACALLFAVAMIYIIKVNQILFRKALELEARLNNVTLPTTEQSGETATPGDSFWTRMRKKYWEDPVPQELEEEILLHHDYDGIRELDNRLPPWWVNMFILTILYAVAYMYYFHWGGSGENQVEEYNREVATAKKELAMALVGKANAVDESTVVVLEDRGDLNAGELTYKAVCAACHGQKGEGGVGPNFTDDYWIHGGGIKNIFKTIKYGVPEKGMISWQAQLKPADIQKVASYILTLQGTNPPNPKAAQGSLWTGDSTGVEPPAGAR